MSDKTIENAIDNAEIIPTKTELEALVERLAALSALEYEQIREEEAKQHNMRVSALDQAVGELHKSQSKEQTQTSMFPVVVPWHKPVDGNELLNEVITSLKRFIVCDEETAIAATLWCVFTWFIDDVEVAPLAVITAPEKRCGKSQLLNLMGQLVCRPLVASNISPSATFRVIEAHHPTLLIDEVDTFLKDNEELRGVINSGHTRQSAYVIRNVGDQHEPKQFSTWGAKALSGIGNLPDTIMDRAIMLRLRRKLPHESVERLRYAETELFETLVSKLARFADDNGKKIARARPSLPDALNDRAQDNWEPLLAIADIVGEEWPSAARSAALTMSDTEDHPSLSIELLADIKDIFDERNVGRIFSYELIAALCADEERPWATYNRGQSMSPRQLCKRLSEYGIQPTSMRMLGENKKGYKREQFEDAFARYIPDTPLTSATTSQTSVSNGDHVTETNPCDVTHNLPATPKPASNNSCDVVTDKYPPMTEEQKEQFEKSVDFLQHGAGMKRIDAEKFAMENLL